MGVDVRQVREMKRLVVLALVTAACGAANPVPAAGTPLSVPQLKFAVMNAVGKPAYCDPDFWPLARDEMPNALTQYSTIKADTATYQAILAHEQLPSGDLTDDQKLTAYRAWKLLRAVALTETYSGHEYVFDYRVTSSTGYEHVHGTVRIDGVVTVSDRGACRGGDGRPGSVRRQGAFKSFSRHSPDGIRRNNF